MHQSDHGHIERLLAAERSLADASEAHGTLAGGLCAGNGYRFEDWLREIRDSGKVIGLDRIAVMAALNLAHEFLKGKERESKLDGGVGQRVRAMRERVEGALEKGQQLEL